MCVRLAVMLSWTELVLGKWSAKEAEAWLEQSRGQFVARGILPARFTPKTLVATCSPQKQVRSLVDGPSLRIIQ
jgi:hypothetical protein